MAEHKVSYAPSEDLQLIKSTAGEFLDDRYPIEKVRELMISDDGFERSLWKEMADLGWAGLAIAEDLGGSGLGQVEMGVVLEEMGKHLVPGPFFASAVLATNVAREVGEGDVANNLLGELAAGELIATVGVFEQPRGWSLANHRTKADLDGDGWSVSGRKLAVLDAALADRILITATTSDGVGVFVVDRNAAGLTVEPDSPLDLTRRQATISLDNTPAVLLSDGDATPGLKRALRLSTVTLAAEQLGGAQAAMDMAVEYAKSRYQFGRPIGSYQAIKHRCANMLMKVEHTRSAVHYAARITDDDSELAVAAHLAGSIASETYTWVAGENIQVHGGIGFTWEHDAHLYLKRAKATSLLMGSPGYHRDQMGQAIGI